MRSAAGLLSALLMLAVPASFAQTAPPGSPEAQSAITPSVAADPTSAPVTTPTDTPPASTMATPASKPLTALSTPASPSIPSASPGSMLQVMVGLLLVLGLLIGITWFMKKMGAGKQIVGGALKIVGGISVGNRERILVVEVADQWIVVGITPTTISALSTMPRQAGVELSPIAPLAKNFSDWLKQTIEKRSVTNLAANNASINHARPGPDNAP